MERQRNRVYMEDLDGETKKEKIIEMDPEQLSKLVKYVDKLNHDFKQMIVEKEELFKNKKFDDWLKGHEYILS